MLVPIYGNRSSECFERRPFVWEHSLEMLTSHSAYRRYTDLFLISISLVFLLLMFRGRIIGEFSVRDVAFFTVATAWPAYVGVKELLDWGFVKYLTNTTLSGYIEVKARESFECFESQISTRWRFGELEVLFGCLRNWRVFDEPPKTWRCVPLPRSVRWFWRSYDILHILHIYVYI